MTIKYADGRTMEGFILSRNDKTMRVAVKDGGDAVVLSCVNGTWTTEDCEAVEVEWEWQKHSRKKTVAESDCICSKELAARLIQVLLSGDEGEYGSDTLLEQRLAGLECLQMMESTRHTAIQSVN